MDTVMDAAVRRVQKQTKDWQESQSVDLDLLEKKLLYISRYSSNSEVWARMIDWQFLDTLVDILGQPDVIDTTASKTEDIILQLCQLRTGRVRLAQSHYETINKLLLDESTSLQVKTSVCAVLAACSGWSDSTQQIAVSGLH